MMRNAWCALMVLSTALSAAGDELVLLSPHWEGIEKEFARGFREHYKTKTGRDVELRWIDAGGTSDILRYIRSQFKERPEGIGVDLFFGGGTDPYTELKELGLLASYRVPDDILNTLAPDINGVPLYDAEDYTWYAATMAGFGMIYNKVVLQTLDLPRPQTWADLARPEFQGWVGSADPRKSGSVHMAYEIILQAYGWEAGWRIIHALGANVRAFSASAGDTPQDTAMGEVACGLAIDFYAWRQVRESGEEYIGYVMPEDLTVVNGDAIGILKGAPSRALAQKFINYVLSEEGQKLWVLKQGEPDGPKEYELGRFAVTPALYDKVQGRASVTLNPFKWTSTFVYDPTLASARWGLANDLIGAMVIDPHQRLKAAWKQAIKDSGAQEALPALSQMPITEEQSLALVREVTEQEALEVLKATPHEAKRLAGTVPWRDQEFRNRCLRDWSAFALQKYGAGSKAAFLLQNLPAMAAVVLLIAMVVYMKRRAARL